MLRLIWICCILTGVCEGNAQDTLKILPQTSAEQDLPLRRIHVNDLPGVIKEKISGEEYSGWSLKAAYRTFLKKENDQETDTVYYIVELKKGQETIRVRFDGNGGN